MGDNDNIFEGIAVVGVSGRFPGSKNVEEFWQNLRNGVESISELSDKELIAEGVPSELVNDPHYVKNGFFLEDIDMFDAEFFGYNPREASIIDPQQRLFLESSWAALENAGYNPETYKGLIGIYAGAGINKYIFNLFSSVETDDPASVFQKIIGVDKDFLSTRVSYKLNLKGPSLTVQTACSTSLVAVHLACQSLWNYECDMALAGGVSINLPQNRGYLYQEGMILSHDGHCRSFDAGAMGTGLGSGLGIVVLKRVSDAMEDRDTIHAVIKGSAINNDGSGKMNYTAPGVDGQTQVIAIAQAMAQVEPDTISYHEAHGTGTKLGDPIEIDALTQVFRNSTNRNGFCAIGSVKTNIGHLDVAAGIAGLIKTVLSLKHKEIPPSLNFTKPNPIIDMEKSPFRVINKLTKWESTESPRRASVSSFGIGGTNAHLVLEQAPPHLATHRSRSHQLLLLSARSDNALAAASKNLADHLKSQPKQKLADVAYTLQVGRKTFTKRRFVVCQNHDSAINSLKSSSAPQSGEVNILETKGKEIIFMFSGQGSQYINMGLELYKTEPIFKKEIDKCSKILMPHLFVDLRSILYPGDENTKEGVDKLRQTFITQPALFVVEYSLAKLLMSWGLCPTALVGHSIGEYVAACLSGVFSLEDALALVSARGRLIQELPGGSMLAVPMSEEAIKPFLNESLSLAVINSPSRCVVSGKKEDITNLKDELTLKNIVARELHTSHAFHSTMMAPILEKFAQEVRQITLRKPQIPFVSNVSGTFISSEEAISPNYWVRHLRQTVRFSDCIKILLEQSNRVFIEVGPGNTLSTLTKQHSNKLKEEYVIQPSMRHPYDKESDVAAILKALGHIWTAGIDVNWENFYNDESRSRVPLPTYPFERKRHWIETSYGTVKLESMSGKNVNTKLINDEKFKKKKKLSDKGANSEDTLQILAEELVAEAWREVLGVDDVDVSDNFINLGGDSLAAVRAVGVIKKKTGIQLYPIMFSSNTLRQIAAYLVEVGAPLTSVLEIHTDGNSQSETSTNQAKYRDDIKIDDVRELLRVCLNEIKKESKGFVDHLSPSNIIERYRTPLRDHLIINKDDIANIEKDIDKKCGKTIRYLTRKALIYQLVLENINEIDKQGLPSGIVHYLREDFNHILCLAAENNQDFIRCSDFQFLIYIKKLCLKSFPVGMLDIEISGFSRSLILKQSFPKAVQFASLVLQLRGNCPLFEFHYNPHRFEMFGPEGLDNSLRLVSRLLEINSNVKGVFGASWFNDPALEMISPELSYLREMTKKIGGKFFFSGSSEKDRREAFAFSKSRKEAYNEGIYNPLSYLLIIPRRAFLEFYQKKHKQGVLIK